MAEPIILASQNSPRHRNSNLLCSSLGDVESINGNSFGHFYIPRPQTLELRNVGQQSISNTVMAAMVVPGGNFQPFYSMDLTGTECYLDYTAPLSIRTSHPHEQFQGYYPTTNVGFVASAPNPTMPPHSLDMNLEGFYGTPVTQQPPLPPAEPEHSVPSNQSFYYHPCHWLGGPQCDGLAPGKNREMGEHLRVLHQFIGHERDPVECLWDNCGQSMQRMNIPRHIVSRHLLAAASCRYCAKQFSRPDVVSRHERTCTNITFSSSASI